MRNFLITLGLLVAAAAAAYGAFYFGSSDPAARRAARAGDAMVWLRTEFRLDEASFAAIEKLHEDYAAVCSQHCAAIMAARERSAPAAEMTALQETCVRSMTEHFRHVAALMPPGEGERYLATVLPRVADYDHTGAPTVQARR